MEIICPHNKCTGCQACRIVCPKNCISMQEDECGHIYPVVDQSFCIDCKKCQKVCASLNPSSFSNGPIKVYAGWSKDEKARKYSTSGAISYVLSKYFLITGDAFCGAVWTMNGAEHRVSTNIAEIKQFQGSKYSHSDVKECYKEIKDLLESGKKVLFTGTPCQIAACRNFLNKGYEHFYTVDIICHGVPSRRVLRDRIKFIEKENGKKVIEMRFRDKQPDQLHTCCKYTFEDNTFVMHEYGKDFFFRSFVDNYILRENCYKCPYSRTERVSDITIADFWGYKPHLFKFRSYEKGVSIILINTNKGSTLFSKIESKLVYEERDLIECGNQNLYRPQDKPQTYECYWKDYNSSISRSVIQDKYLSKPVQLKKSHFTTLRQYSEYFIPNFILVFLRCVKHLIKR